MIAGKMYTMQDPNRAPCTYHKKIVKERKNKTDLISNFKIVKRIVCTHPTIWVRVRVRVKVRVRVRVKVRVRVREG